MNRDRLDWAHMTRASRVMLVTYPIFLLWLGLNYVITPEDRLTSSSVVFQTASEMFRMPLWGTVFLAVMLLQVAALCVHSRTLYQVALCVMFGIMLTWFTVFAVSVFQADASPGAPAWPFLAMAATIASWLSLDYQEAQP